MVRKRAVSKKKSGDRRQTMSVSVMPSVKEYMEWLDREIGESVSGYINTHYNRRMRADVDYQKYLKEQNSFVQVEVRKNDT